VKVEDVMTREVISASPDTTVNAIARLMAARGISGVPIVDALNRVVGIVTELDMIVRNTRLEPPAFFQILDGRIPIETPAHYRKRLQHMLGALARDVMTEDPVTIGPEADVENLAELLVRKRVSPVPVVDGGRLVGIVSRADIIRMMAQELDEPDAPTS
jgi:CBS-domain-containing membrane protein